MTEIAGSGSISQRHRSADPDPDPPQNVMDPQHCNEVKKLLLFTLILISNFFHVLLYVVLLKCAWGHFEQNLDERLRVVELWGEPPDKPAAVLNLAQQPHPFLLQSRRRRIRILQLWTMICRYIGEGAVWGFFSLGGPKILPKSQKRPAKCVYCVYSFPPCCWNLCQVGRQFLSVVESST